jgi:hypothetical protein
MIAAAGGSKGCSSVCCAEAWAPAVDAGLSRGNVLPAQGRVWIRAAGNGGGPAAVAGFMGCCK